MELIGEHEGYKLYKNSDGFIEAYKMKGKRIVNEAQIGTGLGHIVTNCRTIQEYEELISCNKKSTLKPKSDQPTLFPE